MDAPRRTPLPNIETLKQKWRNGSRTLLLKPLEDKGFMGIVYPCGSLNSLQRKD
jgi:hypothetical protein